MHNEHQGEAEQIALRALMKIATGGITGEPNSHRDTLSIVRSIAREALEAMGHPLPAEPSRRLSSANVVPLFLSETSPGAGKGVTARRDGHE